MCCPAQLLGIGVRPGRAGSKRRVGNLTDTGESIGSSFDHRSAEDRNVRLHRIELLTEQMTVDLPFHHQTTVVAGLDRLEGEALALEILAALDTGRPGLSADLSTHVGRRLEVRRPLNGPAHVIDVDTASDATADLTVDGLVQPLAALGVSPNVRITQADLALAENQTDRVLRLARINQELLWGMAITLAELDVDIARLNDDTIVGEPISPEAARQIEQARTEVDLANERLEQLSDQWIVAAAALVLVAFAVALITHPLLSVPFIGAAMAVGWHSWTSHQRHETALKTEQQILDGFGLESYLDFQLRKVDALTNDTKQRRSTLALVEKRRFALDQWHQLVGPDVTLEWAATHRPTIAATATQLVGTTFEQDDKAESVSLAMAERIRAATSQAEPSPLLIHDIFFDQGDAAVERLLWLIDHHCQQLQFIVLSSDERVLRWAAERTIARQASILRLTEDNDGPPIQLTDDDSASVENDAVIHDLHR